tara:strand:+ start:5208 stop:5333 length:126 start_codon:yes stop_codon:yes gene_type:complete
VREIPVRVVTLGGGVDLEECELGGILQVLQDVEPAVIGFLI